MLLGIYAQVPGGPGIKDTRTSSQSRLGFGRDMYILLARSSLERRMVCSLYLGYINTDQNRVFLFIYIVRVIILSHVSFQ